MTSNNQYNSIMNFLLLFGLTWCITHTFGGCPTLYNVPCSVSNWNPGRNSEIFGSREKRVRVVEQWKSFDESIKQTCDATGVKYPPLVVIYRGDYEPGYCSMNKICNDTLCLELGSPSNLFTEELQFSKSDLPKLAFNKETHFLDFYITKTDVHTRLGMHLPIESCNADMNLPRTIWDEPFSSFSSFISGWKERARQYYDDYCNNRYRVYDYTFTINGPLNFFCSSVAVCNEQTCLLYSPTSLKYAKVSPANQCIYHSYPNLHVCGFVALTGWPIRQKRGVIATRTGLFNLPFTKYCGPGTDVLAEDDSGGPVDATDVACRQHDIAYMLGEDPAKADEELLNSVWGTLFYYPFWVAIRTKKAFEMVTGKAYTSALYVTPPGTAASLAHFFYFKSVFDGLETSSSQLAILKEKEESWKNIVLDIWRGQCYVQQRPGSDTASGSGTPMDITPSGSQSTPSDATNKRHVENPDDEILVTVDSDYPPPPQPMNPCRVVINEIQTDNGLTATSFVELLKVCPSGIGRHEVVTLKNYYLAVLKAADPLELHVFVDLGSQMMDLVSEPVDTTKGLHSKKLYYFVVGSTKVKEKNMNLYHVFGGKNGIPAGSNRDVTSTLRYTFSVVLLHSDSFKNFATNVRRALPVTLTDEDQESFGIALQDIVTYGDTCSSVTCSAFIKWNLGLLQLDEDDNIIPIPVPTDTKASQSINRCARNNNPMQQESWETAKPTPKGKNECSVNVDPPYKFKNGVTLRSSAQYVVMNVRNFFHAYKQEDMPTLLEGSDAQLTAKSTGVSLRTVTRIEARHKAGTIQTPRKKPRTSKVLFSFTEEDKKHIKKFIQDKYKVNAPPFFEGIYEDCKQHITNAIPPRRMCGKSTFRKLLYMMGFHYGRINTLQVVLERPDIVVKRGVYLRKMKENDESPTPKPVIYTDESWIDPHARSGKAWLPKARQCDPDERLKYTYAKHHTNRGKRLIMIHAAGPNGLIHESEAVFSVGGSRKSGSTDLPLAEDYHDNVDSAYYFMWFGKLCENVRKEYGDSIIVIDNAPYHTKSDAPTSRSKKQDLLDYLQKVDGDGKFTDFNINQKKYLRAQLWEFVLKYKKENYDHYIIDRLAKDYGHTVMRLPPHQCDLNPIEMLWAQAKEYVRQRNIDQKLETVKAKVEEFFTVIFLPEDWNKLVEHTKKLREDYWINDGLYDVFLDTHEDRINDDPSTTDEEAGDSTGTTEYGPLDAYLHAGTNVCFDADGNIVSQATGNDEECE